MIRRVVSLCFILGALLTAAAPVLFDCSAYRLPSEKKECTVYVTRTRAKYHRTTCSSLRYSRKAVSRSEAIAAGYTACKRCGGSVCE